MELKLSEAVRYAGSTIQMGYKENTDEPNHITFKPISTTYVWKKINLHNEVLIYIIQHEDGELKAWFQDNSASFNNTNFDNLHDTKRYIYVLGSDLTSLDRAEGVDVEEDIPSTNIEEDIPSHTNVQGGISDIEPEIESIESSNHQQSEAEVIDSGHEIDSIGVNYPHYNRDNCSPELMVETTPIPKVCYSRKMTEPFTIEKASGDMEKARAGDFLMLSPEGNIFIEPKETFGLKFEIKQDVPTIKLGEKGSQETHVVSTAVKDYVNWLLSENENLRTNLYLK